MRWLRREAFRSVHLGPGPRVQVVSHSWGEVIGVALWTVALFAGVVVFVGRTVGW